MDMKLNTGDICFYQGKKLTSKGVRILTSIRYGIPFKETLSHVDLIYDGTTRLSAEPEGAKLKDISEKYLNNHIEVYRFIGWSKMDTEKLKEISESYINIKYAYARYGLDAARIFSFVLAFLALVSAPFLIFGLKLFWIFLGLAILIQATVKYLLKNDKITKDCAELTTDILVYLEKITSFCSKNRNEFPNNLLGKMQLLISYEKAIFVGKRVAGKNSNWEWQTEM